MKKTILALLSSVVLLGCYDSPNNDLNKYKKVVSITTKNETYTVTIQEQIGGNYLENASTGALIGGGIHYMLGGSGTTGAVVGGLLGTASTSKPKYVTYNKLQSDIIYTVTFDDSSTKKLKNYCPYSVGDSVLIKYNY